MNDRLSVRRVIDGTIAAAAVVFSYRALIARPGSRLAEEVLA